MKDKELILTIKIPITLYSKSGQDETDEEHIEKIRSHLNSVFMNDGQGCFYGELFFHSLQNFCKLYKESYSFPDMYLGHIPGGNSEKKNEVDLS